MGIPPTGKHLKIRLLGPPSHRLICVNGPEKL
jgi:hypothetical protein